MDVRGIESPPNNPKAMKQLKVKEGYDCDICFDEGEYEVSDLSHGLTPKYLMQKCECTLKPERDHVEVSRMPIMNELSLLSRVMDAMRLTPYNEMVWVGGHIFSLSLPSAFMRF